MKDLLIVEDDPTLGEGIRLALQAPELRPQLCRSLADAGELLSRRSFDLLILDINLPDGNGLDLLRALRRESEVPVILLTANDLETDIVAGLELGADDYITKPFSLAVLRARVNTQLRRTAAPQAERVQLDGFTFDFGRMEFSRNGVPVELSKTEQKLLRLLVEHRGQTLTRAALETRMAHYLSASAVSAKNLAEEKDAIKTLIGDISHQTKTPIANLLLYAQLLEEQDLPPESREYASALEHQAEKLRFLIDALVKTSRLESGVLAMTPKRHGIQQLLDAASAQAAPGAEAKAITLTVEPTDLTARFDPKWTAEALYNLVDNAVKYTPAGGAVTLRAVGYELFCRVDVTDTGPGIPESEQARIFQRFYRSPSASEAEGVGIGLYLARQIAAGQGGYLKVSSRPGEGSTFSLFLPRAEERT